MKLSWKHSKYQRTRDGNALQLTEIAVTTKTNLHSTHLRLVLQIPANLARHVIPHLNKPVSRSRGKALPVGRKDCTLAVGFLPELHRMEQDRFRFCKSWKGHSGGNLPSTSLRGGLGAFPPLVPEPLPFLGRGQTGHPAAIGPASAATSWPAAATTRAATAGPLILRLQVLIHHRECGIVCMNTRDEGRHERVRTNQCQCVCVQPRERDVFLSQMSGALSATR